MHFKKIKQLNIKVTERHAREAIYLTDSAFAALFRDKKGKKDFGRSQNSSGMASKSKWKKFIAFLSRSAETQSKKLFSINEMREVAKTAGLDTFGFNEFVDSLNNQGFLIKKGRNLYQLQTI